MTTRRCLLVGAAVSAVLAGALSPGAGPVHAASPPTVTAVSPNTGPLEGVVEVAVTGTGFFCGTGSPDPNTVVYFGATAVSYGQVSAAGIPQMPYVGDTEILVTAPVASSAGTIDITVHTSLCGTSATGTADHFTYQAECATSCTVTVDGTTTNGSALGRSSGILEGPDSGWKDTTALNDYIGDLNALNLKQWRTNDLANEKTVYNGLATKPALTYILSPAFNTADGGQAPWTNNYADWNTYVHDMDTGVQFCGSSTCVPPPIGPVAYWDVFNEPLTSTSYSGQTPTSFYNLYADTYHQLIADVPSAKVIAPAVTSALDWSLPATGNLSQQTYFSMKDLFAWIVSYNNANPNNALRFAAFDFHILGDGYTCDENAVKGCPQDPMNEPMLMADTVNRIRNLLTTQFSSLLPAQLHVNEYDSGNLYQSGTVYPTGQLMPGSQAGYITAFEQSNVDQAGISCWTQQTTGALVIAWNQCAKGFGGLLDDDNNLLSPNVADDNIAPQAIYWVYKFYGTMTGGTRVAASTPTSDLTAFATRNDTSSTMQLLLGRARRCSINTSYDPKCPAGGTVSETVTAHWPYGGTSVGYTLQRIPDSGTGNGGVAGNGGILATLPTASTGRLTLSGGVASLTIPTFNDGDAWTLTLTT